MLHLECGVLVPVLGHDRPTAIAERRGDPVVKLRRPPEVSLAKVLKRRAVPLLHPCRACPPVAWRALCDVTARPETHRLLERLVKNCSILLA